MLGQSCLPLWSILLKYASSFSEKDIICNTHIFLHIPFSNDGASPHMQVVSSRLGTNAPRTIRDMGFRLSANKELNGLSSLFWWMSCPTIFLNFPDQISIKLTSYSFCLVWWSFNHLRYDFWKCSWAHIVIFTTESCLFSMKCYLRAQTLWQFIIIFHQYPLCTEKDSINPLIMLYTIHDVIWQ